MSSQLICLALMLCAVHSACGLYFHISETERKCFIEEVPDETTVIVNYKVELYDPRSNGFMPSSPGIGMQVEVRDSDDKVILSRVYSSQGRMSFTSHTPGEHVICMYSNSTAWFNGAQLRVHLDIQVGAQAIDYANMKLKEKLPMEELRIRQLLDQLEQIAKEQNYQRYREQHFRNTNKSTNSLVLEWSLLQAVVLICLTLLQMLHLNSLKDPLVADETLSIEGSAPCIQQSQIKHSAVPNAQFMLSDTKDTVILKATAAIQIGEEIWISDLDDFQLERSRKNSIFDCQCQQCRADSISDMISEEENEDRADSVN